MGDVVKVEKIEEETLSDEIGNLIDLQPSAPEEVPPAEDPPAEVLPEEKLPEEKLPEEKPPEEKPPEEVPPAELPEEGPLPSESHIEEPAVEVGEWTPPTREEYTNLLTTMNDLAGKVSLGLPAQPTPEAAPAEELPKETSPVEIEIPPLKPLEFVASEEELYELSRNPQKFNELMNKIVTETHNRAVQLATQNVLTSIPQIVGKSVEQATTIQRAADEFYKANEDLIPFKRFVMMVTNETAAANPGKSLSEILPIIATESRKKLNLKEQAVQNVVKENEQAPAFVKVQGVRRKPASKPTGVQGEIDEMLA